MGLFDKDSLTVIHRQAYDALVRDLKAAPDECGRHEARILAMIPGASDLQQVPGALLAAEVEADTPESEGQAICDLSGIPDVEVGRMMLHDMRSMVASTYKHGVT